MATTLTGTTVQTTYDSLIKVGDNGPLTSTNKVLSDGLGNELKMQASTTTIAFTGNVNFASATVQNLATSDLTNDSGFTTTTYVNSATASLSASLAVDIASNAADIATNASDILGLDNQIGYLTTSASLALITASNDFSELTFTKGNGTTFPIDATPRKVIETVKNADTVTLPKGTPVYVSGSTGNASNVYKADAGNASKMPAAYVLDQQLTVGQEGTALLSGFINGVDTSAFQAGQSVYVAVGGGYTNVKPTGSALIQKLGNVIKVDANGSGVITGAGRSNDVPNISPNYLWMGNSDSVATPILSSSIVPTTALTASYVAGADVDGTVASANLAIAALTATNADNLYINEIASGDYGLIFRAGDLAGYQDVYADTEATSPKYSPATNTLSATIISASTAFNGTLDGNASTATTASYALTASYVAGLPTQFSDVVTITSSNLVIDDANIDTYKGKTLLCDNATSFDFEIDTTTTPSEDLEFYLVQFNTAQPYIINYAGSVFSSVGSSPTTRTQYSSLVIKHIGSDNYLVMGDIA